MTHSPATPPFALADEQAIEGVAVDALIEVLRDARDNGLIYWEPNTERGAISKMRMLARVDAILAKAEGRP